MRLPCFRVWLPVLFLLGASLLASEVHAQGYYYGGGSRQYRSYVPYNNNYHGYWRDQGYGYTPGRTYYESFQSYGYGYGSHQQSYSRGGGYYGSRNNRGYRGRW